MWVPPWILDRLNHSEADVCIWEPSNNSEFVIFIAIFGHHGPCVTICVCYVRIFVAMRERIKIGHGMTSAKTSSSLHRQASFSAANANSSAMGTSRVSGGAGDNIELATVSGGKVDHHQHNAKSANSVDVRQKRKEERERRAFVLLTYVILSYLFCWVPFHIVFDISAVDPDLIPDPVYRTAFWLTYFNSTLNPLLYAYSSPDFRKAFKNILSCAWRKKSNPYF